MGDTQPAVSTDEALYCPTCGYDVRGLTRETCPERGEAVEL